MWKRHTRFTTTSRTKRTVKKGVPIALLLMIPLAVSDENKAWLPILADQTNTGQMFFPRLISSDSLEVSL